MCPHLSTVAAVRSPTHMGVARPCGWLCPCPTVQRSEARTEPAAGSGNAHVCGAARCCRVLSQGPGRWGLCCASWPQCTGSVCGGVRREAGLAGRSSTTGNITDPSLLRARLVSAGTTVRPHALLPAHITHKPHSLQCPTRSVTGPNSTISTTKIHN